jgi:hypothetical protein
MNFRDEAQRFGTVRGLSAHTYIVDVNGGFSVRARPDEMWDRLDDHQSEAFQHRQEARQLYPAFSEPADPKRVGIVARRADYQPVSTTEGRTGRLGLAGLCGLEELSQLH